jgi:putative photosynthetic complex assembly protein
MTAHTHEGMAPRGALRLAAALVVVTLALVAAVRLGLVERTPSAAEERVLAHTAPTAERLLLFRDRDDGAVVIDDATTGARVAEIGREGGGFIRGVMRGLARERRQHGVGAAPPFRLTEWRNGALSLTDTATGRVIELGSFGATNRAAFARLLATGEAI